MPFITSPVAGLPSLKPRLPTKATMQPYVLQAARLQRAHRIFGPGLIAEMPRAGEMHPGADLDQAVQHLQTPAMGASARRARIVREIYQNRASHRGARFATTRQA